MSEVTVNREALEELFRRTKNYISKPTKAHAQGLRQQMRLVKSDLSKNENQTQRIDTGEESQAEEQSTSLPPAEPASEAEAAG